MHNRLSVSMKWFEDNHWVRRRVYEFTHACRDALNFQLRKTSGGCALYKHIVNKKLSYRRESARCGNCHSRSLKVIRCCAN